MLPKEIYENNSASEQIISESPVYWNIDRITTDGGIKQYVTGAEYPFKGHTSPEIMFACNQAKRLIVQGVKVIGLWGIFIGWRKLLEAYTEVSWKIMSPYILKYEFMTEVGQEIRDITVDFLMRLNLPTVQAILLSKIFSHLIEYDNAYRYRIEDIMSESKKEDFIKDPRKEIKRLIAILKERDAPCVAIKFERIGRLLSLASLIPRVRKALRSSLEESNWEKLQADKIDRYWMSQRSDFLYEGLSFEERKAKYSRLKMPKAIKR